MVGRKDEVDLTAPTCCMFSMSLQFPKMDRANPTTRSDAVTVTLCDISGSALLSLILIDQTAPDQSMGKLPIPYFAASNC